MKNILQNPKAMLANMHSLVYTMGVYLNHRGEEGMEHLSITFPEALREELDLEAKRGKNKKKHAHPEGGTPLFEVEAAERDARSAQRGLSGNGGRIGADHERIPGS